MKYSVVIEDYGHRKVMIRKNFETLKEAFEFMKKAKKIYQEAFFSLNFFT